MNGPKIKSAYETAYETAVFAGGCFWCMVSPFYVFDGIIDVTSGYMGGHKDNPTYEDVKSQISGHYEVVKITYDPDTIDYDKLLKAFWMQIDPTDSEGQFHDRGPSYKSAIFYTTEEQKEKAEASKKALDASGRFSDLIVTEILPAAKFYEAEEYHQDYHEKNPTHYKEDRQKSGRDEFIKEHWGEEFWELFEE